MKVTSWDLGTMQIVFPFFLPYVLILTTPCYSRICCQFKNINQFWHVSSDLGVGTSEEIVLALQDRSVGRRKMVDMDEVST